VDGLKTYQGKVRYVSSEAAFTPYYALTQRDRSRLSYLAEIDFTEASAANLPGGVPVEVTFPDLANN
jgi:HlyD family secretion protein